MSYPAAYRSEMTGETLKIILEDVADNLFNPDPYYQQGGDMVRVGGMGYAIDVSRKPIGSRITEMTLLATGEPIDPARATSSRAGPRSTRARKGPPIWDVVEELHQSATGVIQLDPNSVGAGV